MVADLITRIEQTILALNEYKINVVFVDDGSTDNTLNLLKQHSSRLSATQIVVLSRNFGHQIALTAALDYADGDYVCCMDGDLQDEPENIREMLALSQSGFDVVYAVRRERKANFLLKICYKAFYRLLRSIANIDLPLDSGDFCIISRKVADNMRKMRESHRFIRGLRAWVGYKQIGYAVNRPARKKGESKYSLKKLIQLASAGLLSFSTVPLRLATLAGFGAIILSAVYTAYSVYIRLSNGVTPSGFTALITTITFLGGVQLVSLGIIGEYLGRIFEQVKNRPLYLVSEVIERNKN